MMTMDSKQMTRRWHDRGPEISKSVRMMCIMPVEIQSIVADGLVRMAESEFNAHEVFKSLKSLGKEKVLGLYQSQNKRREYDKNPAMHKAMSYLYVLSEENQDLMASQMLVLMEHIFEYFMICTSCQVAPRVDTLRDLTNVYVRGGSRGVQDYMQIVKKELEERKAEGLHLKFIDKAFELKFKKEFLKENDYGIQIVEDQ